jgi:hypothetical protein
MGDVSRNTEAPTEEIWAALGAKYGCLGVLFSTEV